MKKIISTFVSVLTILTIVACSEKKVGRANVDPQTIEKDFIKWWTYHNENIRLSSSFIAIDNTSERITKEKFLELLTSGDFIPIKLVTDDSLDYYKLFELDDSAIVDIKRTIKETSRSTLKKFRMEGKPFPKFSFVDLNGRLFDNENTKGKIVVLKTWFINCKPCIAEFPKLNNLVSEFENLEDFVFISLALDESAELQEFISEKPFKYSIIPNQDDFISNALKIRAYPTHFIINKDGLVEKIVNDADELISLLQGKKMAKTNKKDLRLAPPPPPPPPPAPATEENH